MPFNFKPAELSGLMIIEPRYFGDRRGFFAETYKKADFAANGIPDEFVQDNHSRSGKGVLRGLHYQLEPKAQGKLVRVIRGAVWDVAVDIRKDSPTFKKWFGIEVSEENRIMFYVPPGFAHGFITLTDDVEFLYKCTDDYSPAHERGIRWDDPDLAVKWPMDMKDILVSDRDAELPFFKNAELSE